MGLPRTQTEESEDAFIHARVAVGTSAVQLSATSRRLKKGVCVKAADSNIASIYVGLSTVTAGTTAATDGYELSSGQAIELEIDNINKVYVISTQASQNVFYLAL